MQREFESLMKQANEMRKLPPKTVIVFPSFDEHEQMLNEAKQGIPMPDVPTRQQSRSEKSRLTAGGMTMGLVASPLTGMGTLHAMKKYLPNASPRLFAGLGATSLVAPVVAGTAAGHAIGKHRFDKQEAIRKAYEDQVKERYGDIELKRFTDMLDAQIAQRKQASVEFEGLVKQATEMTKLAQTFTDGPDEMEEYDRLWNLPFKHNTYKDPKYREMQKQYGAAYRKLREEQPFERPERTTAEKIKQYAYPAIGLGLGGGLSYLDMKLEPSIKMRTGLFPLFGLGAGAFAGNIGYASRTFPAYADHHEKIVNQLKEQEAPLVKSMSRIEEAARRERLSHPDVQAFIKRFGYNPFEGDGEIHAT